MTLSEELTWRGFINQTTIENLADLDEKKLKFYHGYDASADSLTVGNLAAIMMDKVFVRHGQQAFILAGGATSLIGDPGGKDSERPLQSAETINSNIAAVRYQIEQLFDGQATMVNNLDWFKDINVLEFLRDTGKYFSMTPLVQRDYIARRIGEGGTGITYTEFSYTLLQGYDFLHLFREHGVTLQLAGSDQWGNSLSGVELLRRAEGQEVHVLTCPLIINKATGKKFGKSEDGAVWLDPTKTSPYKFYQFWLNSDDEGVEGYLKVFTELDKESIDAVMKDFNDNKGGRKAQKTLAYEITKLIHGEEQAKRQEKIATALFGNDDKLDLNSEDFDVLAKELPTATTDKKITMDTLASVLVTLELASSKTEARRFITNGAIYINNVKVSDTDVTPDVTLYDGQSNKAVVLRRGKNKTAILKLV